MRFVATINVIFDAPDEQVAGEAARQVEARGQNIQEVQLVDVFQIEPGDAPTSYRS